MCIFVNGRYKEFKEGKEKEDMAQNDVIFILTCLLVIILGVAVFIMVRIFESAESGKNEKARRFLQRLGML